MIPQLKAKLEEKRIILEASNKYEVLRPSLPEAFDQAVSILMPVIEKLVKHNEEQAKLFRYTIDVSNSYAKALYDYNVQALSNSQDLNQEILKLLEGGE